jgi:glycosyltransferase involved in cell wall biosynthesis
MAAYDTQGSAARRLAVMRILLITGIWPPDVGGPATHGPELARFLVTRGHDVTALTMADEAPSDRPCRIVTVDRGRPFVVRYPTLTLRAAALAIGADVVYASATYAAAAAASLTARRPLVVKLVSDPAFERARRYGLFAGSLERFQQARGIGLVALKRGRTLVLRRAGTIVVPSEYLARLARAWALDEARIGVVPNPAPAEVPAPGADVDAAAFVFAGRLTAQKSLDVALHAVASVPEARLTIFGDGPERARLERLAGDLELNGRIEFTGARPRRDVLEALSSAGAALLPSAWENLPHAAVEALAVGTPVVATAVGGVPEVVRDGENGLLVPPGAPEALAAAMARLVGDHELRNGLAARARPSVAHLGADRIYEQIEQLLVEAAA